MAILVGAQGVVWRRRRAACWPDRLEFLAQGYPHWPGLRPLAGAFGLVGLLCGCVVLDRPATFVWALIGAVSLLHLVHREWNEFLAELGLGLVTVAVCARLGCLADGEDAAGDRSFAGLVLTGLSLMTFMWHWLPRFWEQQLQGGVAWTTTGRLIPSARRLGWVAALLAAGLALRLAAEPWYAAQRGFEQQEARFAGAVGVVTLFVCLLGSTLVMRRPQWLTGGLTVVSLVAGVLFFVGRW